MYKRIIEKMTKGRLYRSKALFQILKVLWHLDIFRRSFRDLTTHICMEESCIICALKDLFTILQSSHDSISSLGGQLGIETFLDKYRLQLGHMDDAAECFENVLLRIHGHIGHMETNDGCVSQQCISHRKFAMSLLEQGVCTHCGTSAEPATFTQMVQYVSASALTAQVRHTLSNANIAIQESFGMLLKKANNAANVRKCPNACGNKIQVVHNLINHPEIVSIGLVWNSDRPSLEHIMDVLATIGTSLRLIDIFHDIMDKQWANQTTHHLTGLITYSNKHYSTFLFNSKLRIWIYFDDVGVNEVGPRWEQVVEKCRRGKNQPLLLLYANPKSGLVSIEDNKCMVQEVLMKRSVTPSPDKSTNANIRRALTPNPDAALMQKPPLPKSCQNDYQNLAIIQHNIHNKLCDPNDDSDYYITKNGYGQPRKLLDLQRSGSNSSDIKIPDHLNVPRRRDSGNWSGDRNSASSASSTTLENPYSYLIGKVPSPTKCSSSGSSGAYDAGYDSYSLSSNDSSALSVIQNMKIDHLAKIPEDLNNARSNQINIQSSDQLCDEAEDLLSKSRQLEIESDLVLALALCNAATKKARDAMDAPYNNPQALTLARMKHNTCIMRARSLHRRITQTQCPPQLKKENPIEVRHTREGSSSSQNSRHSRQNSRDKTGSKSNSNKQLRDEEKKLINTTKTIEIYATLPKKKDHIKSTNTIEDEEYIIYDNKKPVRESRSIFSRGKSSKESNKIIKETRSRSEDRNRNLSLAPNLVINDQDENVKEKNKKQHKIRRKLLLGGLIKRKNRSMPDLTEATTTESKPLSSIDDSNIGMKNVPSGYLSEGHFESNATNPNLERSKLMRKSFHGSAGKILTVAKVPPPPPLRTTSQLNKPESKISKQTENVYHNTSALFNNRGSISPCHPYTTIITTADVHQEQSPMKREEIDEVDCALPPYPSPVHSINHSRQPSEEFPPPPPPLDTDEPPVAEENSITSSSLEPGGLLAQLQSKRLEILTNQKSFVGGTKISGDIWLKELQAKQASLRTDNRVSVKHDYNNSKQMVSVKDLSSKFESTHLLHSSPRESVVQCMNSYPLNNRRENVSGEETGIGLIRNRDDSIPSEQIAKEIKEVETLNELVQKTLYSRPNTTKANLAKKKSVSFCDQVILVATADEEEDDGYIPNPILERVLRCAGQKTSEASITKQEIMSLRENELRKEQKFHRINQKAVHVEHTGKTNSNADFVNGIVKEPSFSNMQFMEHTNLETNYGKPNIDSNMYAAHNNSMEKLIHRPPGLQNSLEREEREMVLQSNLPKEERDMILQSMSNDHRVQERTNAMKTHSIYQYNQEQLSQFQNVQNRANTNLQTDTSQHNGYYYKNGLHNIPYPNQEENFQQKPCHVQNSFSHQSPVFQSSYQIYNMHVPNTKVVPVQYDNMKSNVYQRSAPNNFQSDHYMYQRYQESANNNIQNQYPNTNTNLQAPLPQDVYNNQSVLNQNCLEENKASVYQRIPLSNHQPYNNQNGAYQRVRSHFDVEQKGEAQKLAQYQQHQKCVSYHQLATQSPALLKKSISFQIFNNNNNDSDTSLPKHENENMNFKSYNNISPATQKLKCNLCRKKYIVLPSLYCKDCEFYMSRFKHNTSIVDY